MKIVSHEHPEWTKRIGRINGAQTYSQDLIKYQIPEWEKILGKDDLISTCPKLSTLSLTGHYDTVIQYLHVYPYDDCIGYVGLMSKCKFTYNRMIFITAYKEFQEKLVKAGFKVVYIPMAIDTDAINSTPRMPPRNQYVWFGNMDFYKRPMFLKLHQELKKKKIVLHSIAGDKLNGAKFSDTQRYKILSMYKYGFGVGRCAQEMMTLGLKVIIAGRQFGGLITIEEEYQQQLSTNMNGRICTYSSDLGKCLANINNALTKANNIKEYNHAQLVLEQYELGSNNLNNNRFLANN